MNKYSKSPQKPRFTYLKCIGLYAGFENVTKSRELKFDCYDAIQMSIDAVFCRAVCLSLSRNVDYKFRDVSENLDLFEIVEFNIFICTQEHTL